MTEPDTKKYYCNECKRDTSHYVRREFEKITHDDEYQETYSQEMKIIECCGCEHLAFVQRTNYSADLTVQINPRTKQPEEALAWKQNIYPPVTYRSLPIWHENIEDCILRDLFEEIYKALQMNCRYLATTGSRTLIDRLIVLIVGDQGNFARGLEKLKSESAISEHEHQILTTTVEAGSAAAHRGWAPTKEELVTILDTIEGLIHRLLVLPERTAKLEQSIPNR